MSPSKQVLRAKGRRVTAEISPPAEGGEVRHLHKRRDAEVERQFLDILELAAKDCGVQLPNRDFEDALRDLVRASMRFSKYAPSDWPSFGKLDS
jgi:hypothetical protein